MASTQLIYDPCAYKQKIKISTDILDYQLYGGKYSNDQRQNTIQLRDGHYEQCTNAKKCYPDKRLLRVDIESDLRGIDRVASQCVTYKYNPNCNNLKTCVKKNDPRVPVYSPPYLNEIRPYNSSKSIIKK